MASLNSNLKDSKTKLANALTTLMFVLFGVLAWIFYYHLNQWLLEKNFAHDLLMYFGERRSLLNLSTDGGVQNTLFVLPFISYLPVLFLKNPLLAASFVGATALTLVLIVLFRLYLLNQITWLTAVLLTINFVFNPGFIYLFSQLIHSTIIGLFLAFTAYTLRKYYFERISAYLLLFSICLAILVTNGLARYYIFLVFLPAIAIITYTQKRPLLSILLVVLFPTLFFILINFSIQQLDQIHACKICTANAPLAITDSNTLFLASHGNYYVESIRTKHSTGDSLYSIGVWVKALIANFALMLPYWSFWLRIFRYASVASFVSIAIIPVLYMLPMIYLGMFQEGVHFYFIFTIFSLIFYSKPFGIPFENDTFYRIALRLSLVTLFFAGSYKMLHSKSPLESNFTQAIFGMPFEGNLDSSRELLQLIKNPGKILLDDQYLYKVIYLSGTPNKFIVPFQSAFDAAINDPAKHVEYVVVSKFPSLDKVLSRYPSALMGQLKGFHLVKEVDDAYLFERNKG